MLLTTENLLPLVLSYSLPPEKAAALARLCEAEGVLHFCIPPRHYLLPISSLPVADGGPAGASPLDPPALPEEMLLFKGFPDKALVRFLRAYREAGLEKIELKASLTPHNAAWDSLRLYAELCQERDALR